MGRKSRERRLRVTAGLEPPFRQHTEPQLMLRCGKCGTSMVESRVADHLRGCQPGGAKCGKCGGMFGPAEFLGHFKGCDGKKPEPKPTDVINRRDPLEDVPELFRSRLS